MGVVLPLEKGRPGPGAGPGAASLASLVAGDLERVNTLILDKAGSNAEMIPEIARHLIDSGGKRLRPMLTLAGARMFGYDGDGHISLAASVEFMHTATLLHDDVVDESDMRRGKASARLLWGNQASVLVGDYLLGQAFKMMVGVGSLAALDVLATAASVIAEGEVMQLSAAKNLGTDERAYLAVIRAKTAALFSAAAEVGPIVARADAGARASLADYGMNLGLAFQLVDDALDYGGSSVKLGKRVGDDFREGKITLPVVLAHRRGTPDERAFWSRAVERGEIADGDLERAIGLVRRHGAIEETLARARAYGDAAVAALEQLPHSPYRTALVEVVDFAIARAH